MKFRDQVDSPNSSSQSRKKQMFRILKKRKPLIVGFLPENDCAPIVVAQEMGFFNKHGLAVELQREQSWRNIHDKVIRRQLDAGQAPAALPFLINLGLTPEKARCLSGMVLSLQGNAITISRRLWDQGVRDPAGLRKQIVRSGGKTTYTFGVSCPLASPYFLLCQWLKQADIPPGVDVRIVPVPPSQMFPMLKLGYLDGFCGGEPWTSVAVQADVGACVSTSALLAPLHPEKVLMVRSDFAASRVDDHQRLIAALLEACAFCDLPQNRHQLCDLLALPQYVNAPIECLEAGLLGPFGADDSRIQSLHGLHIFHRYKANDPAAAKAAWITSKLYEFLRWDRRPDSLQGVFNREIFLKATAQVRNKAALASELRSNHLQARS